MLIEKIKKQIIKYKMQQHLTPRKLEQVNSASSNLMQLDLALFESYQDLNKNHRGSAQIMTTPPSKYQSQPYVQPQLLRNSQGVVRTSAQAGSGGGDIQESLRKQVRRNLKLINAIHRSTEGLTPAAADGGCGGASPQGNVLKCQSKHIVQTNRERTLGERAKFYKNKQGRWAFHPKLERSEVLKEALAQRGISPHEIQMLHQLTEASIALTMQNRQLMNDSEVKKHTSLPITQAIMSQRQQPQIFDTVQGNQKNIGYANKPIPRMHIPLNNNRTSSNTRSPLTGRGLMSSHDSSPRRLFGEKHRYFMKSPDVKNNGSHTQRIHTPRDLTSAGTSNNEIKHYRYLGTDFYSTQNLDSPIRQNPPFEQYLEQANQMVRVHTTAAGNTRKNLAGNNTVNIPLKTAMIKYRETKKAEAEASKLHSKHQKLHETLKPFSNSALQDRVIVEVVHTTNLPVDDSGDYRPLTTKQAQTRSSRHNKLTTTVKSFFDPEMTYQPPKQREFIVPQGNQPRKRLKELFKHYQSKGDYYITSQFLRGRDWIDLPSRLNELKGLQKGAENSAAIQL